MAGSFEVLAIKYAELDRTVSENFADGRGGNGPMPMDYFIWVIRDHSRVVIVDTGFGQQQAKLRGRTLWQSVPEGLAIIGVDPSSVEDVILTHLHYDHAGGLEHFPRARVHVSRRELEFVVGPDMANPHTSSAYVVDDIATVIAALHAGRARLCEDEQEIFPGITTRWVGGHTGGSQIVEIEGTSVPVVLISDAAHFYANFHEDRPFPVVHDGRRLQDVYRELRHRESLGHRIIPGHDPDVFRLYPPPRPELRGWVADLTHRHEARAGDRPFRAGSTPAVTT